MGARNDRGPTGDEGTSGMNDDETGDKADDDTRDDTVVPLTRHKCPMCGKAATAAYKPFCSKRCADLDLARWLGEGYRIPTDERPGDGDFGNDEDG